MDLNVFNKTYKNIAILLLISEVFILLVNKNVIFSLCEYSYVSPAIKLRNSHQQRCRHVLLTMCIIPLSH